MDRDTLILVVSILILIAFQVYSDVSGSDPNSLVFSLPLITVLTVFLLFLYTVTKAEKRLNQSLERRLPEVRHIDNRKEVEAEITRLAKQAKEFIVATGGRSRNKEYLQTIEHKVTTSDLTYWRLMINEQITHEMCKHLCSIMTLPNVMIGIIDDKGYSSMLVVDSGLIIALPVPGHGGLMGIKIPNNVTARRMFRYLMMVFPNAQRIRNPEEVKSFCEQCATSGG